MINGRFEGIDEGHQLFYVLGRGMNNNGYPSIKRALKSSVLIGVKTVKYKLIFCS